MCEMIGRDMFEELPAIKDSLSILSRLGQWRAFLRLERVIDMENDMAGAKKRDSTLVDRTKMLQLKKTQKHIVIN